MDFAEGLDAQQWAEQELGGAQLGDTRMSRRLVASANIEQCLRWRIEDWHRVLKPGCSIDKLMHETAERLRRAIAINLVIGWRIMLMTLLGRETPGLPAEVLFSDIEIRTLRAYAKKRLETTGTAW
ncbi:MAG: transposase DNA-binding-containing protein [Sedimenticola sp.]